MYAVVADVHLGNISTDDEKFFFESLRNLRKEGLRVIWLGDTFDLIWQPSAYAVHKDILRSEDTILIGNHDFSLLDNNVGNRHLRLGNTILTHGDYLDFGFFTARMEYFWENLKRLDVTFIEILAKILYPHWKFEDVNEIFKLMLHLDNDILQMFSHTPNKKINKLRGFVKLFSLIRRAGRYLPKTKENTWCLAPPIPHPARHGHAFGYFTYDATELYKRFQAIYPRYSSAENILVGHIHKPTSTKTSMDGKFMVVGSWKRQSTHDIYPTVPILNSNGDIIEVREYR